MKHSTHQTGSAHVIIIIVLVVALLGVLGFVFWQNFVSEQPADIETGIAGETAQISSQPVKTLTVSEWGIEGSYESRLTLVYQIAENNPNSLYFSTLERNEQHNLAYNNTAGCFGYKGAIVRYLPDDRVIAPDGTDHGSVEEYYTDSEYAFISDGYYYTYQPTQSPCDELWENNDIDTETTRAIKSFNDSFGIRGYYYGLEEV